MKNLLIALSLAALGATLAAPSAQAQRRGGFVSAPAGRGGAVFAGGQGGAALRGGRGEITFGRGHSGRRGGFRHGHGRGPYRGSAYAPYLYPGFGYPVGLGFDSAYQPLPETPASYEPAPEAPPAQADSGQPSPPPWPAPVLGPVLLELKGDHWVRTTADAPPQVVGQSYRPNPKQPSNPPAAAPSAVLVFRDGHQEEIGQYCIIDSTIHITTDYWSTGSWTRTVKVSDLDIPATLKLNQQRGTNFRLPSGPYEVMIGG